MKQPNSTIYSLYQHLEAVRPYNIYRPYLEDPLPESLVLTESKTRKLVALARSGDKKSRAKLCKYFIFRSGHVIYTFYGWGLSPKEIRIYAKHGINYAIDHFDLNSKEWFDFYLHGCMRAFVQGAISGHHKREWNIIKEDTDEPQNPTAVVEGMLRWSPMPTKLRAAIDRLPDESKTIICALYGVDEPKSSKKLVCERLSLSARQVTRIKLEALTFLKLCL